MKSYKKVLGGEDSLYGLLSGDHKDTDARYVFATIQTLAKDKWLEKFKANDFDMIVIDESHHSGAETYQDVMAHFQPKMWLGMTATPERTDGFDIYSLLGTTLHTKFACKRPWKKNCFVHFTITVSTMML